MTKTEVVFPLPPLWLQTAMMGALMVWSLLPVPEQPGARLWYNGFVTVNLCVFVFLVRRHADSMTAQTEVLTDIERKLAVLPPEALKLVEILSAFSAASTQC